VGVTIIDKIYSKVAAVAIYNKEPVISEYLLFCSPLKHLFKPGYTYLIVALSFR
jgi:hypothetical protein